MSVTSVVLSMVGLLAAAGEPPGAAPVGQPAVACDHGPSRVSSWERSLDGTTWEAVTLPDTDWGCDNCTRYYRVLTCGKPKSVEFRWASDNKARLLVNGQPTFEDFWKPGMCTDKKCCAACCDNPANCKRSLSKPRKLKADAIRLFTADENELRWEVFQETGGSGFQGEFKIGY